MIQTLELNTPSETQTYRQSACKLAQIYVPRVVYINSIEQAIDDVISCR